MTDVDPFAGDKCEHGCWEPKVWVSIMDETKQEIRSLREHKSKVRMDASASEDAKRYVLFIDGKIEGLKAVLSMAEGQRMIGPTVAELERENNW